MKNQNQIFPPMTDDDVRRFMSYCERTKQDPLTHTLPATVREEAGNPKLFNGKVRHPRVFICAPITCAPGMKRQMQIALAELFSTFALSQSAIPVAPGLFFVHLDFENERTELKVCEKLGPELVPLCDEFWVFPQSGHTDEMVVEYAVARKLKIPVRCFDDRLVEISLPEFLW